ncbi:hypothetical protein EVAR_45584_1 [Eumeta japonica]|uniref:Uncharacterized protein n=1 Tax=Eumeta variegata TaxID=151549 RepID=A0A4C1YTZ4_EUMVA|nr:hypothetical protein EVAR_45584_1 [Eumeta japonica]
MNRRIEEDEGKKRATETVGLCIVHGIMSLEPSGDIALSTNICLHLLQGSFAHTSSEQLLDIGKGKIPSYRATNLPDPTNFCQMRPNIQAVVDKGCTIPQSSFQANEIGCWMVLGAERWLLKTVVTKKVTKSGTDDSMRSPRHISALTSASPKKPRVRKTRKGTFIVSKAVVNDLQNTQLISRGSLLRVNNVHERPCSSWMASAEVGGEGCRILSPRSTLKLYHFPNWSNKIGSIRRAKNSINFYVIIIQRVLFISRSRRGRPSKSDLARAAEGAHSGPPAPPLAADFTITSGDYGVSLRCSFRYGR